MLKQSLKGWCGLLLALVLLPGSALATDKQMMVSSAHKLATAAGLEALKRGGSAVDAAIVVQLMLNVVEPQSSGIGGGAFMLYFDAARRTLYTFDGRETAPTAVDENLFAPHGKRMQWRRAVVGGRAVGAPGVLAMMALAHGKHGKLPWATLFESAINTAANGFRVSPRLSNSIASNARYGLGHYPAARKYFFTPEGAPLPVGTLLRNPVLADTFSTIAKEGPRAFYSGAIAHDIAAAVSAAVDNPGRLTVADMQRYRAKQRAPLCATYHEYRLCGMGPPTSGGITVIQIMKMLEGFNLAALSPLSPTAAHLFTQAARLAYADRVLHIADADFYPVPVTELLSEPYLQSRARLIDPQKDMGTANSGLPYTAAAGINQALPSTTHFSIVDRHGNALSMTSSIENAFGSTLMVRGFLLNNQLTDFSFAARDSAGLQIANRVQANKRPRSSMSPMIVFDAAGKPMLVIGSPGGSRIINYVAKTIMAVLDHGLDLQNALDLPHYTNRNGDTDLERDTAAEGLSEALRRMGHTINVRPLNSGLHAIHIKNGVLYGAADLRREGTAQGM